LGALLALAGCGGSGGSLQSIPATTTTRQYSGSASVGDFLSIAVDNNAHTIAYTNKSNGDTGTVSYTVNADGSYAITDPTGNFTSAYEIPNYAMVIAANKTGPNHNTPALVTAVASAQISASTFGSQSYNTLSFRTNAGGLEAGSVTVGANVANLTMSSYWPLGASQNPASAFNNQTLTPASVTVASTGNYLTLGDPQGSDYAFGTPNGLFVVDTGNGTVFGLPKAATKAFDPSVAGTYSTIVYEKKNVTTGNNNVESGVGALSNVTITVDSSANVTVRNSQGATVATATMTPVADAAYLNGPGKLSDPCFGLFTFRLTTATSQQDVFAAFESHTLLFATFTQAIPATGQPYSYSYGVGLH